MKERLIHTQREMAIAFGAMAKMVSDSTGYALTPVTFANLPAAPAEGMIASVTDSNTVIWGDVIAGGGTDSVLAWYDGTNWIVVGSSTIPAPPPTPPPVRYTMAGSSFTGGLDAFNPSFFQLSGAQDALATQGPSSLSTMVHGGSIIEFGTFLDIAPGLGATRTFQLQSNGVPVSSLSYVDAAGGFQSTTTGLPVAFTAGAVLGLAVTSAGFPVAATGNWSVVIEMGA